MPEIRIFPADQPNVFFTTADVTAWLTDRGKVWPAEGDERDRLNILASDAIAVQVGGKAQEVPDDCRENLLAAVASQAWAIHTNNLPSQDPTRNLSSLTDGDTRLSFREEPSTPGDLTEEAWGYLASVLETDDWELVR